MSLTGVVGGASARWPSQDPALISRALGGHEWRIYGFRDALELSLLATALAEKGVPHEVPWRAGGRPIRVLPAAGVFGANASGKSNLQRAIADMRDLVLHGIRHEYGFVIDDVRVREEWAYRYPRGKAALLFRRDGDAVTLGEHNRAKGRAVVEILRPNSLLRAADLGITDARVREPDPQLVERLRRIIPVLPGREDDPDSADSGSDLVEPNVVLSHRGADGDVDFDAAEESLGTLVWLGLAGPVVEALAHGSVLLVDEIETSLHPALVAQLVRLFQDQESNRHGAQLVFNSHAATLLGDSGSERVLGRDQVWFTEKAHDGATMLYALADLSPRGDEAIGRRYLAGRYGAVPILAPEEFTDVATSAAGENQ